MRKFQSMSNLDLTSQIKRAILSIPTNIVEGYSRKSKKEFIHFINISIGSLVEVKFSVDLGYIYINEFDIERVKELIQETGKLLWGLQRSKLQI
ncbi:MAG: four helix bundle protein [Thermodesulfovibrionales bacterium]|nr:four helix bundle protein [Thermodesulfovibrionales bacterium]